MKDIIITIFAVIIVYVVSTLLGKYVYDNNTNYPTAIDVYQGKTTIQIIYEDSIPVDSVVVYKPQFRK